MLEQSYCFNFKCNYISEEVLEICPNCGKKMRTAKQVKRAGWIQFLAGIFLVVFMGYITYKLLPYMLPAIQGENSETFTGTGQQALVALILFGGVIILGLLGTFTGLFHIITGRRNKHMSLVLLGLGILIFAFGWLIKERVII